MSNSPYRAIKILVPACFVIGAGMELFMIKVPIGGKTFYDVAKRKRAERIIEERETMTGLEEEREERRKRLAEKYGNFDK